jgi:Conjugative transposon protein TcpC
MRDPPSPATTGAGVLFPELADTTEPAPPVRSHGSRVLRLAARVVLWGLIVAGGVGGARGLLPTGYSQGTAVGADPADRRGEAVAAAFLREYLTVGDDPAARERRLSRFAVAGADLQGLVSAPAGLNQYVDQVVVAGSRRAAGGVEVTVLAHVLQVRSGAYRDGGTLAFVVPVAVLPRGVAVRGRPRPTALPIASGGALPAPRAAPTARSRPAGRLARRAVDAFVAGDGTRLARLGGGRHPSTRGLPAGWHAIGVGDAEVTEAPGALVAEVAVRVRPPTGPVSYVVPVRVHLTAGPKGLTVGRIDAGGPS